ncbi:hypothetical protein QQY24_31135 [Streptomyces sp. TG1A-8]|uniref:hypothetical protein n=1 Tax=Streptomyces sp. TG1A-8 TaxID=3051385 RepID=UPI00265B82C3|nr:hypothetical protein [Streptomyces sp. TG1A-8]MDO0929607.1 hypothetical protein [Streptomyces sp. TG1A-8]
MAPVPRRPGHPHLALSADWPAWSKKQARSAGLVCTECDYDLRDFKEKARLPYDIRLPEKPNRLRLACGQCCDDGVPGTERPALLGGKTS